MAIAFSWNISTTFNGVTPGTLPIYSIHLFEVYVEFVILFISWKCLRAMNTEIRLCASVCVPQN